MSDETTVESLLSRFDRTFAEGRLEAFVSLFADDALVLFHHQPAIVGRHAIRGSFSDVFAAFDTSEYESHYDTVEVHPEAAYVIGDIVEVLRPQAGGRATRVRARVVLFLRRIDGTWLITRLLTGRAAPNESR